MAGLYDDTPGLSDGTGLWRGRLGLFSGASGFINGSGGAYVDLYFSAGTYSVAGNGYTTLGSIPGFTFTRASLAMGYDATGKLAYGPNNLLLRSADFNNVGSWAKTRVTVSSDVLTAPDGTLTADKLVEDTSVTDTHIDNQVVTVGDGAVVLFSVYAKAGERGFLSVSDGGLGVRGACFNLTTGAVTNIGGSLISASAQDAGSGWFRCTIVYRPATTTFNARLGLRTQAGSGAPEAYTGDGTSGLFLWGAQLQAVTYQTTPSTYYPTTTAAYYGPRLVYDPVTLASQGILVEEARTNLLLQSQTFGTTWITADGTLTANDAVAPDGTTTADKLVGTAATAQGRLVQNFTGSIGATYTLSCYVKSAGGTLARLYFDDGGVNSAAVTYNSITGAVSSAASVTGGNWTAVSSAAQQLSNGWWRFSLTFTATAVAPVRIALWHRDVSDGTNGIYLWQAQLEARTGASSPIPTTTASVTRAADDAVVTGLSLPGPCSFATDALAPAFVSTDARHTLSDGTTNNRLWLSYNGSVLNPAATIANTGVAPVAVAALAGGVAFKAAVSSSNGTYLTVVNGGTVQSASGGVMPTLNRLDIGKNAGTSLRYWNNTISRIRIYNRALSDAELQAITQSLLLQEDGYSILQEDNSYIWLE